MESSSSTVARTLITTDLKETDSFYQALSLVVHICQTVGRPNFFETSLKSMSSSSWAIRLMTRQFNTCWKH